MLTPNAVQQQMYTRERRGIFRSTEGFDTIARSQGLDQNYIKKVLHPFCQYDAPAELLARTEKEGQEYPDALHVVHMETGETIIGRSIYQPADFTGLRSAFFTHNYVIPAEFKDSPETDYHTWLNASFAEHYDIELGMDLPVLPSIPAKEHSGHLSREEALSLLQELKIDEQVFKQLLFAAMASVAGKKKVYIALDVEIEQLSEKAKLLLALLFSSLPYGIRRQLGFLTYANEPQSKKGIQMMFVEKGSLRLNDRNIEKDFLFEMVSGRVLNTDLDWSDQPYLDFAWNNLGDLERAERFYEFAARMLKDMEPIRQIAIASYHELAVLFQMEEGNFELYEQGKPIVLRSMLDYLSPPDALPAKISLNDLFLASFDLEFDRVKQGEVPENEVMECIKDFYRIDKKHSERKIVEYFIRALNNAISQNRKDALSAIYVMIESDSELSHAFFGKVLASPGLPKLLFNPYIENRLKKAAKARDVVVLLHYWAITHPIVLDNSFFTQIAETQLMDKLRKEAEPVKAVNQVLDQLDELDQDPQHGFALVEDGSFFVDRLLYAANLFLLKDVQLDKITKDQLLQIGFLNNPKEFRSWVSRFDTRTRSKGEVMLAAYQWFSNPQPEPSLLRGLSPEERDEVQKLGQNWLRTEVGPSRFGSLTLAFCYDVNTEAVDYNGLMEFLQKHAPHPETVYEFIQWSAEEPAFVRPRGLVPAYATAIVNYFKTYDPAAFKNKENVRKYFDSAAPVLKPVYAKVKSELASPLMKYLRGNPKVMRLGAVLALMIVVIGGMLIIIQANGGFEKEPDKSANAQTETPATEKEQPDKPEEEKEVVKEIPVLTSKTIKNADKTRVTQLIFNFKQPASCRDFKAGEVTVVGKDDSIISETLTPNFERVCAADPVQNSGTGSADSTGTAGLDGSGTTEGTTDSSGTTGTSGETSGTNDSTSVGTGQDATGTAGNTGTSETNGNNMNGADADLGGKDAYTSSVKLKLSKKLDLNKVAEVLVDGVSYVIIPEDQLGQTVPADNTQNTTGDGVDNGSQSGTQTQGNDQSGTQKQGNDQSGTQGKGKK
ncbi:hypothetical protein [Paenibacillus sp.]|jgi:hypothetical protein|uniref:GAP1-N2 domain-containing protein n=1 Tax=Paenibacillus sp. TaxID=58172 RepID=UPI00282BA88C|nr:hypothetical protein [Paenibacillus sp.]MDR0271616.1 hypothetical protein [Paenibacillus sp.]